jgi:phosphate transport system permease protein
MDVEGDTMSVQTMTGRTTLQSNDEGQNLVNDSADPPSPPALPVVDVAPALHRSHLFAHMVRIAGFLILALLAAVTIFLLAQAAPLLTSPKSEVAAAISDASGGQATGFWQFVGPLVFGTLLVALLALLIAVPISLGISLFIVFYCPVRLRGLFSGAVDLLAAVPSVIYGLWGGLILVPTVSGFADWLADHLGWIPLFAGPAAHPPRTVATASLVLAIMIMPIITSTCRDLFRQSSTLLRESAMGLGATRWETLSLAVVRPARNGIISAIMLGLGRALGETMAVLMILAPGRTYSFNLLQASKSQTIAANIAAQFPEAEGLGVNLLIASGLVLFVITFLVGFLSRRIAAGSRRHHDWGHHKEIRKQTSVIEQVEGQRKTRATDSQDELERLEEKSSALFGRIAAAGGHSLKRRRAKNIWMTVLIWASMMIALIPLLSVLWTVLSAGLGQLNWYFLTHNMKGVVGGLAPHGGIFHAMIGTLEITLFSMLLAIPIGILSAIWLVEYADGTRPARLVDFLVDIMAGIPSIVAGLFAYSLFSVINGPGTVNGAIGSVALSILMLPTVIRTTEEMLRAVPNDLREASYGLGVTRSRTICKVVLPAALPGIVSGVILAIARVIGETAPLLVTTGVLVGTNWNLFNGRMMTLPVYVYQEYSQGLAACPAVSASGGLAAKLSTLECVPDIRSQRAWAAALVLILFVLLLSIIGRLIIRHSSAQKGQ